MSIVRLDKIIAKRNALETLANKHKDVLNDAFLNKSDDLKKESFLREEYERQINANRDLQIGIVGRVKAGKSSLLNALLFDGSAILPKAATPMTAALTILSYSEKLKVTVHFFKEEDFAKLKEKSRAYEEKLQKLVDENIEKAREDAKQRMMLKATFNEAKVRERAISAAKSELSENIGLSGAFDQYQQIKESSVSQDEIAGNTIELHPKSVADISIKLADYIGVNGKYTPFTQSVEIAYPNEKLKGIRIIDTPGFNDPVPSRQERAEQLLKVSDVVLILSSANRFIDKMDKEILNKITTKDGLRELFIIASQVDSELLGDEYQEMSLDDVRKDIAKRLSRQARSVLESCNSNGAFDQLINDDGGRVLLTSADCHSMYLTFEKRNDWDDDKKTIWKNLCDCFKDYFSNNNDAASKNVSKELLKQLGNIKVIEQKIDEVKKRKNEILADSANKICTSWESAVNDLKTGMEKAIQQQIDRIKKCNINQLQNQKNSIESFCLKVESGISNAVNNAADEWCSETRKNMMHFVDQLQSKAENEAKSAKTSFTRQEYSHTTGMWWWKRDHYSPVSHTSVSPFQLRASIENYTGKVNNHLKDEISDELSQLKRKISSNIIDVLIKKAAGQDFDEDVVAIKINAIIKELNIPDFRLPQNTLPTELLGSDAKEDTAGDHLLAVCRSYLNGMANRINSQLIDEINRYANTIKMADLASKLLEKYRASLDKLISDIKNKEKAIDSYEHILKELEMIA